MQDQPIDGPELERVCDGVERVVLSLLLDPRVPGPWSLEELVRETGSELVGEAVVGLHAAGLVHRLHEFVFASRSAARFQELAGGP